MIVIKLKQHFVMRALITISNKTNTLTFLGRQKPQKSANLKLKTTKVCNFVFKNGKIHRYPPVYWGISIKF